MKIGLISSAIPLVAGGYRHIVEWLECALRDFGHQAETVYLPSTDDPATILEQMHAFRLLELNEYYDRVITFRPPAHVVRHHSKIVWFIHHIRQFYDLWDSDYNTLPRNAGAEALRATVIGADTNALREARRVFANSATVAGRLREFNGIEAEVLFPPILNPSRFRSEAYGDEILCVCRMEHHKRQHLLVEALARTRSKVRLRLCGPSQNPDYVRSFARTAEAAGVSDRLSVEAGWISEERKVELLAGALASAYVPYDEDSYGYPTLEAAHARRCTVTVADSGGVPEFVQDGISGAVVPAEPAAIADAFDRLHGDRGRAKALGEAAGGRIAELGIGWPVVIEKLLS